MFNIQWDAPDCIRNKNAMTANLSNAAKVVKQCRLDKEINWIPDVIVLNAYEHFTTLTE